MEEELAGHDKEGEVVESPADEEESTEGVVFHDFG